jgi:hypothetical protein
LIANIDERVNYSIKIINIAEANTSSEKIILLLYIPESPKKPHMITFNGENAYYLRHNKSVNIATHSEVREMFEYSRKQNNYFHEFLLKRNLFDSDTDNFGNSIYSNKITNEYVGEFNAPIPKIIYSIIPKYLDKIESKLLLKIFCNG